ncbi:MAG: RluA family pseudouridine synthase [Planctomycetota bacterium]
MSVENMESLPDIPAGARLDALLRDRLDLSRSQATRLLDLGWVEVNRRTMKRSDKGLLLKQGDKVAVDRRAGGGERPAADSGMQVRVLGRGSGWLAVDKPAGVPVRPRSAAETGTLLNAVVAMHPEVVGVGEGGLRSGVVHRLDRDTSGVLIIAIDQAGWELWRAGFAEHRAKKRYLAIVSGRFEQAGRIERDLSMSSHRPARVRVDPPGSGPDGARRCAMGAEAVEYLDGATLIWVDLETGFLHQIRAIMASIGHPVLGDRDYGDALAASAASRQMLHAAELCLDGERIESPLPIDVQRVIEQRR